MELSQTMISVEALLPLVQRREVKMLDASWYLPAEARNPYEEFLAARIPGSRFFDIEGIADQGHACPHMLPSAEQFAEQMEALGVEVRIKWSSMTARDCSRHPVAGGCFGSSAMRGYGFYREAFLPGCQPVLRQSLGMTLLARPRCASGPSTSENGLQTSSACSRLLISAAL